MGKKSPPAQPAAVVVNAGQSASDQAEFNREAALEQRALNLTEQVTPEGTLSFGETGETIAGIPQIRATQTLSPVQQSLFDTSNRVAQQFGDIGEAQLGQVSDSLSQPFNLESFGAAPVANEGTRSASLDAILARLQPQRDQQRSALETSLVNQGFVSGSAGFDDALDQFNRSENDLRLAADAQAGNEQARLFGLETNARDRAINEALLTRNQPLTELSALLSGSQPSSPNFLPTPQGQIAAPDLLGAEFANANIQNQFALNNFNQQNASRNANVSGLFGLAGAGLGGFAANGFSFQ